VNSNNFAVGRDRGDQRDRYDNRSFGNDRREPSSYSRGIRFTDFSADLFADDGEARIPRAAVPLPTQPPYTAHVGNLAFDLTETEVENYFQGCKVISVRIMKDRIDNRPKGFGYVEFADLDSLKKALTLAEGQLAGRHVRISVAEPRNFHFSAWIDV
jgi:translation initiation factor 4B